MIRFACSLVLVSWLAAGGTSLAADPPKAPPAPPPTDSGGAIPKGLQMIQVPGDNVQTPDKIALGRQLFWDTRLSKSGKMACESCHLPEKGWADGQRFSKRDDGTMNTRHTPTMLNAVYASCYYWDGRAPTLEKVAAAAWRAHLGIKDDAGAAQIATLIAAVPGYKESFAKVFRAEPTPELIAKALASYVRTLISGDSPYDRHEAGDKNALSPAALRGLELFKTKAKCSLCHAGFALTAWEYRNIGIGMDQPTPDPGRGKIEPTKPELNGAFRVPSLRNVARTAPYMHDGRFTKLEQVIDYFAKPIENPTLDPRIRGGVQLTPAEKKDLLAFLKSLDGSLPDGNKPTLPK